jgi:heme-degrading monooxygenase HmoA
MITEIAQIDVKPGSEKDFEAAVAKARPLFLRAKGGKGFEFAQVDREAVALPAAGEMGDLGKSHRRFPRF